MPCASKVAMSSEMRARRASMVVGCRALSRANAHDGEGRAHQLKNSARDIRGMLRRRPV